MIKIKIENEKYPKLLKQIKYPPQSIYLQGNYKILNDVSIAIIGSRVCSQEGIKLAKSFAKQLSKMGICIVSGMACGIDTAAHLGALETGGKTIAVLGSGFNYIYPTENEKIFNRIIESNGAVITEYEENTEVTSQGFVARNRIVSGLSVGVLVIEAKYRSGTTITANFAKEQGKKVFCIPHRIGEKEGIGTNKLIQQGAILVTKVQDIINNIENFNIEKVEHIEKKNKYIPEQYIPIYKMLAENPATSDELYKKLKIDIGKINYILTMMELEGYIKRIPGNLFCLEEE